MPIHTTLGTASVSGDTLQTKASVAEVVCIMEFSSPGPGPCGYVQVKNLPEIPSELQFTDHY